MVTVGGVELLGRDRVLRRLGLQSSPDHRVPPSGWEVEGGELPGGRRWAMSGPPGGADGVVVCLHGRGDDERFAFDEIRLHDVVADEGLRLAVVAVDGGETSYWHRRADGDDPETAVVDQLLPLVAERTGHEQAAVLGWSMGGYGALLFGERHPEVFPVVVASSPALFSDFDDAAPGAFDSAQDFRRHDVVAGVDALDPRRVRIDCGTDDPFLPAARRFAELLGDEATTSFTDGAHDAAYWRSAAPAQLHFIADRLA